MSQLAFPFPQPLFYHPETFLEAPANTEALAWLERPGDWPGGRLALFGPAGSGKTHLLHRFAAGVSGVVMSGDMLGESLEPPSQALAVDNADQTPDQAALLHLLNAASEAGVPVLVTARLPPSRWEFTLPDLVSRLRATTSIGLGEPDDALLRALLARLLAERQLVVPEAVQDFLLARLPRTGASMRDVASRLDQASLESQGRVTRILAAAVLGAVESG